MHRASIKYSACFAQYTAEYSEHQGIPIPPQALGGCLTKGFVTRRAANRGHFSGLLRRIVGLRNEKGRGNGPIIRRRSRIILSQTGS